MSKMQASFRGSCDSQNKTVKPLNRQTVKPKIFTLIELLVVIASALLVNFTGIALYAADEKATSTNPVAESDNAGALDMSARHPAAKLLKSETLTVEVMEPNSPDRYNRGVRFANLAAVLSVRVGQHEFLFNPLEHDPLFEHAGLPGEFDILTAPPGFKEAKIGDGFVKIGVGVLKKNDENYSFWPQHELVKAAETTVKWDAASAEFRQVCGGINGYAYELTATVSVKNNQLNFDWTLSNTGAKPFTTSTYIHNFFSFDGAPVGPNYILSFPYDFTARKLGNEQRQVGRDIKFEQTIEKYANIEIDYPKDYKGVNSLTASNTANGMKIAFSTSGSGQRTAVHATGKYICPEQFIEITLNPGEKKTWSRVYIFTIQMQHRHLACGLKKQ